jgi:hypothetical protein
VYRKEKEKSMTKTPYLTLYYNWMHIMDDFTDAEVGRLLKAVVSYAEGTEPPKLSRTLTVAFKFIINTLDRAESKSIAPENPTNEVKKASKKSARAQRSTKKEEKTEKAIDEAKAINDFTPPTLDEVKELFTRRGFKSDPEEFFNFYESKGWLVGQSPMRNWEASAANFEIKVVRERLSEKNSPIPQANKAPEAVKPRAGNFDIHDAFKKALERSYGGYYDDDIAEDGEN